MAEGELRRSREICTTRIKAKKTQEAEETICKSTIGIIKVKGMQYEKEIKVKIAMA